MRQLVDLGHGVGTITSAAEALDGYSSMGHGLLPKKEADEAGSKRSSLARDLTIIQEDLSA